MTKPAVRFPSTFWTTLRERPAEARIRVCSQYRTPIFAFLRSRGFQEQDADDLTQEVFAQVCRDGFLASADRTKGRFRSLLLGVTRHVVLQARERRNRRRTVPMPVPELHPAAPEEAEDFDRHWVRSLVEAALQRLMEESEPGAPRYYEALVLTRLQGRSYADAARLLGANETDLANWVRRAKERLKRHLLDVVRPYCSSPGEVRDEIALLARFLR